MGIEALIRSYQFCFVTLIWHQADSCNFTIVCCIFGVHTDKSTKACWHLMPEYYVKVWIRVIEFAGLEPDEFVEDMKKKGIRVPGIGHRIKSKVSLAGWL